MAGNRQGAPVGAQNRGSIGVKLGEMADGDGVMKTLASQSSIFLQNFMDSWKMLERVSS